MSNERLGKLSSSWRNKPPKKFKAQLINDVHSIVVEEPSEGNLEILVRFGYFDNVLWHFFNADVTYNHVELVVMLLLYDRSTGEHRLTQVKEDSKFKLLIERCLYITFEMTSGSNYRLQRMIIQLFNGLEDWNRFYEVIISGRGDLGPEFLLKNWLNNVIKNCVVLLYELESNDFITYLQAVILFLKSLQEAYKPLEVPFEYMNPAVELKPYLQLVNSKANYYSEFLRKYYKKWPLKPTAFDLVQEDLEFLEKLLELDLKEIISFLDIKIYDGYPYDAYVNCIKHYLMQSTIDDTIMFYDVFNKVPDFDFNLPVIDDYNYKVFQHVQLVLERVGIHLDKKGDLAFSGKSKYFSATTGVKPEGNVVLLKIDKPNKFSKIPRIKKFGIELIKYCQKISDGFNYYIKLPQIHRGRINIKVPKEPLHIESLLFDGYTGFLDYKHNKKKNGISKVKIDQNNQFVEIKEASKHNYNTEQSQAIYNALINKVSIIDVAPHGGSIKILDGILHNLSLNSPNERTLVVFPYETWYKYHIPQVISRQSIKANDNVNPVKLVDDILQFTSKVADRIGEDGEFFARTITNALIFYNTIVPDLRSRFLKELKTLKYPFADVTKPEDIISFERQMDRAQQDLNTLAPLMKFPKNEYKVKEFLINNYYQFVFASVDQMDNIVATFDNIIVFESQYIYSFEAVNYKRLVVIGDSWEALPKSLFGKTNELFGSLPHELKLSAISTVKAVTTSKELYNIYRQGELHSTEVFSPLSNFFILESNGNVNIKEAETCIDLYNQLESEDCYIVASSLYQHALLLEMKAKCEPIEHVTFHNIIILSLHGYKTYKDIVKCAKRCEKLYIIGQIKEPMTISNQIQFKRNDEIVKFIN